MTKIILLSSISAFVLSANTFINPLPVSVKAIDNGGVKSAIDAYKDGIGAELMDKPGIATDNSAMNILVLKYGEDAKINNTTILDQVINGNSNPTAADLALAGRLSIDGATCNDGNAATTGETWLTGVCQGGIQSILKSCKEILSTGNSIGNGIYTIDVDGSGAISPFEVYCDMITSGGGWTKVVQQFESDSKSWLGGGIYTSNINSFVISSDKLPQDRIETAFGKNNDPTFIDYVNFIYINTNIPVTLVSGKKTLNTYQMFRSSSLYYNYHNPEENLLNPDTTWYNALTFDKTGGRALTWSFSLNNPIPNNRGYAMDGFAIYSTNESYAWTVWVR